VRKLVIASPAFNREGFHPEIVDAFEKTTPEDLAGPVIEQACAESAPDPENWPTLIAKCNQLDHEFAGWSPAQVQAIEARPHS